MKSRIFSILVVAAAMLGFKPALAGDIKVNGFADIILTITDDANDVQGGKNPTKGKFTADGEVDFASNLSKDISVRIDLDLFLAGNGGVSGTDSAAIEQAFFAWGGLPADMTFMGGVFNNPIGWEAEDAPDLYQTSHSVNWNILDNQTALNGNNIAGLALAGKVGPVTLTGAYVNDLQQVNEKNSIAILANMTVMENMDLELGYVSQDNNNNSIPSTGPQTGVLGAGDVLDFNLQYNGKNWVAVFEYLSTDKIIDSSILLLGNYDFGNKFGITGRYETVSSDFVGVDQNVFTVAGIYTAADNLAILLEFRQADIKGFDKDDLITAEFVAQF